MSGIKRVIAVVSLVLVGLLAFAATTVAFDARGLSGANIGAKSGGGGGGGGGFFPPAGNYDSGTVSADFFFCCDPSLPELTVTVFDNINKANPRVGPTLNTHQIDVLIFVCDSVSGICGGGCFIPDGANDVSFSSDFTSATLHTKVTPTTRSCQDSPISGVPTEFTLDITWTSQGSRGASRMIGRYACAGYSFETTTLTDGAVSGSAIASTSLLTGTFGPVDANLNSFDLVTHAQGTALDTCPPLGGKGAGPGPLSAGEYSFASRTAGVAITPDDPSQQPVDVFVTSFVNTSKPKDGSPTTQVETDLNVFQANFPDFVSNCYVIPANAFTLSSDLQTASLHVAIDPTTPACPHATNGGFPDTFSLDITWSGATPVATFRNVGNSGCPGSHLTLTQYQTTINGVATGRLSGIAESFTGESPSMSTDSSTFHSDGRQATC
ncbi:MAG: hypothetical protein E6J28_04925 [Chloroflexi bacterium]|nr:MAG: hypothetical protein E6J28_04925 [Chloroflexota bacterium]